jgi:hypothetical protein
MSDEVKPGYLIQFSKQTAMTGEVVTINTNLPVGATQKDLGDELIKIGSALDDRMRALNKDVLARTGKNLEDMKIVQPGLYNLDDKKEE